MAGFDQNAMLVEGIEDETFVKEFLKANQLHYHLQFKGKKGYAHLRRTIPTLVKESGIKTLGIIADANSNFTARWQSISDAVKQLHYPISSSNPNGTILTHDDPIYPKLGIWIMPNNAENGMLEDFAAKIIPDDEQLLVYADQCISNLPEKRFIDNHLSKARIHTWLAWQEEPGTSLGMAVIKDYLKKDQILASTFLQWLKDLFE